MAGLTPALTIVCRYTCNTCGIRSRPVVVPAREDEDILTWVRATAARIRGDHRQIVPGCRGTVCDLMVPWPTSPGQRIGDATTQ